MAENSKIEWTDHTFNPWTGCMKVSPGCDHCYAEGWSKRAGAKVGKWGAGAARVRTSAANWNLPYKWNAKAQAERRRYRVFCASLADVFDNEVPAEWRADLFWLIQHTPQLDWLLLTKRIGNAAEMMRDAMATIDPMAEEPIPLHNVWLGATVVNQEEADRDIPKLDATPAAVRFLSVEPMLGPIEGAPGWLWGTGSRNGIDWVICGGESGPGARPMQPEWARSLRDQCKAAGVPFLFKQWGEYAPHVQTVDAEAHRIVIHHLETGMARIGKKMAGRVLDGVTHDGYPA
jgi:protein gp37